MPQLIEHIDAIARQKQRDVLTVEFHNFETDYTANYRFNPARKIIIDWLDANGIGYEECGAYANEERIDRYRGQIYIDVPFEVNDPVYQKLEAFLENLDGTMKFDTAWFRGYRLEYCMKNAHHDVPGFWDYLEIT
jgi:hypothetical protein